jgi:hypothetical protein
VVLTICEEINFCRKAECRRKNYLWLCAVKVVVILLVVRAWLRDFGIDLLPQAVRNKIRLHLFLH